MAVVVTFHCPYATLLISGKPNRIKLHQKSNNSCRRLHKFRCLSTKSTPSNPVPEKSQDGDERESVGVKAALAMLRFYKREISPVLPRSCRYIPTCSEYSMEAYKKYGVLKGTVLTTWRLCRCNPLGGSGFDPPRWFGESELKPQEEEDSYGDQDQREI